MNADDLTNELIATIWPELDNGVSKSDVQAAVNNVLDSWEPELDLKPAEPVKQYLASLPFFPGFYETSLDNMIDREIESRIESGVETEAEALASRGAFPVNEGRARFEKDRERELADKYLIEANYQAARLAIAQGWVESFSEESELKMTWESLNSPREYNFTTDRVFVNLPEETLEKLKPCINSAEFPVVLRKMFTSYDGFISSYSNDPSAEEWSKPIEEWDHNQLQALIGAYIIKEVSKDGSKWASNALEDGLDELAQHVWDKKEDK